MTYLTNNRESRIFESLKQCAPSARELGGGRWSFALANGKSFGVTARAVEEWLMLYAPLTDRVERGQLWDLIRLNATLDGPTKFVLMPDNRSVHLRADIPLLDEEDFEGEQENTRDDDLTRRVLEACAAMKSAFRRFRGKNEGDHRDSSSPLDSEAEAGGGAEDLKRRCEDSGWAFVERSAGKLVFDLEARGGFYQATVEQQRAGAHVSVELARWEALGELSRQALAALLLKTGGRLKLARPSVDENEAHVAARFEIRFGAMPAPVELKHALSALSIACTLCGREARVIQDEVIARDYLAIAIATEHPQGRQEAMLMAAD